jgi:hypothetical protein
MQVVTELHATPSSTPPVAPAGLGVAWTVHAVPSQRSASVTIVPAPSGP